MRRPLMTFLRAAPAGYRSIQFQLTHLVSRVLIQTVIRCVTTSGLDSSQLDPLLRFHSLGLFSAHLGNAFTFPPLMASLQPGLTVPRLADLQRINR